MTPPGGLHFVYPGDPATVTGGYGYDRAVLTALDRAGVAVQVHVLPDGFPSPAPPVLARAAERLDAIPDGAVAIIDGLAYGTIPALAERLSRRLTPVALVHHPLADEAGLSETDRNRLFQSEKTALSHARHVIVTSRFTAERLGAFGVGPDRVSVAEPGTVVPDLPAQRGRAAREEVALLSVATVTPRKGYLTLLQALESVAGGNWRLDCVGALDLAPDHAEAVSRAADRFGDKIRFHGALPAEDLEPFYWAADLLVSASYYEGYGMALAEAVAHGVPVLATTGGAVPTTVAGRAACLVEPEDPEALADALNTLISNPQARQALRQRALDARGRLPSWDDAASVFCSVVVQVSA